MKKRLFSILMSLALIISLSACGKKNMLEQVEAKDDAVSEEAYEEPEAVEELEAIEEVEEISEEKIVKAMLESFLDGDEKVYADKYEFKKRVEDDEPFDYFANKDGYTINEFFKQVIETESSGYESFPFARAEYAYIDCGLDGIPELVLKGHFEGEWDQLEREYVIKMVDGKLELTYKNESYYRSYVAISNLAGVVTETGSSGAASSFYKVGMLDSEGRFVLDYIVNTNYMALYMLGSRFDDAVANTNEDYSTLFLRRYAFEENIDGNDFDEYEKRALYSAQLKDDEESNGIDRNENVRVAKTLFNYVGEKLYTLDEINEKIAKREESIGFTDEVKYAKEISFSELDLDAAYINGDIFAEQENNESDESLEPYTEYLYIFSLDCFKWENDDCLSIVHDGGQTFYMDSDTVIGEDVVCNDDDCDAITWAHRYIDHCPITDDSDPDGPYYCLGFGGSDVWQVMIDEDYNIKEIVDIFSAD